MASSSSALSFLSGANALFLEQLYADYVRNPDQVDAQWRELFDALADDERTVLDEVMGASWAARRGRKSLSYGLYADGMDEGDAATGKQGATRSQGISDTPPATAQAGAHCTPEDILKAIRAHMMIRVYRVRGHLNARLDPLGRGDGDPHPELAPSAYGFDAATLDKPVMLDGSLGMERATPRDILKKLQKTYCHSIGAEFMHIQDPEQKLWIQQHLENDENLPTPEEEQQALQDLLRADGFERFLAKKYPGAKRFGLEGGESTIPALERILEDAVAQDVEDVIIGMAHRGRLNVLANILHKPLRQIFAEFDGSVVDREDTVQGSGDVKYHLGVSIDRKIGGRAVHLSLTANPSHLEAVNPVVIGKARAKQTRLQDTARKKVLPILIHGDAAFAGQGLVSETLGMSELCGYKVGGTVHVIINNQIGFTTAPHYSRSSPYCSDVVKGIQAPVFHVNGDDVAAVIRAAKLAIAFRTRFQKDVVLDIYCYRRHGHNEIDEPSFTQPLMYDLIREHRSTVSLYRDDLIGRNVITEGEAEKREKAYTQHLGEEFDIAKKDHRHETDWLDGVWQGMQARCNLSDPVATGITSQRYREIARALTHHSERFSVHKRLKRLLEQKQAALDRGTGIDWATGEALAFGALLLEGYPVRLSGQDSGRGTFSQRHAVLVDQTSGDRYIPLNHMTEAQCTAEIIDSPLSEASVLGFELGYSLAEPNVLVLWEAQFGDFANGAQVIFDQFIASGEAKWNRLNGLVMLLPHGYEGQGPEHSSARLERYLQACAEDNLIVANATTPASYFHLLRRQLLWETRKPLVVMTPKSLLRHKKAVSKQEDFCGKTTFQPLLEDTGDCVTDPDAVTRVILCSGKVYYDLEDYREEHKRKDVAILRLEQLYPFPAAELAKALSRYKKCKDVLWCQEEPQNMGAWFFVDRRIEEVLNTCNSAATRPCFVGRSAAASPATGFASVHQRQQQRLVEEAFELKK